jgi:hypothetical protein
MLEASIHRRAYNVLRAWKAIALGVSARTAVHTRYSLDHRGGESLQSVFLHGEKPRTGRPRLGVVPARWRKVLERQS